MIDRRSALDSNSIADCRFTGQGCVEGGGGGGVAAGADVLRRLVEAALRGVQLARDRAAAAARVVVAAAAAAMKI